GFNYTTVLDVIAAFVFALIYATYRKSRRDMDEDMAPYAKDVVCGMQVEKAHAPARATHDGKTFYFCSDRCEQRFAANPAKFVDGAGAASTATAELASADDDGVVLDPVCGMRVATTATALRHDHAGRAYFFCSAGCRDAFATDPLRYLGGGAPGVELHQTKFTPPGRKTE
ncbi:MAG: uncharacterized protein QOD88_2317, partial [Mycobacterium sp.]|nr:uncharacterized protein [Mycobacterium sp.]